jgi:hypothetical protein
MHDALPSFSMGCETLGLSVFSRLAGREAGTALSDSAMGGRNPRWASEGASWYPYTIH